MTSRSKRKRSGPGRPPLKGTPVAKDVLFTDFLNAGGRSHTALPATPKTQEDAFLELKNASISLAQTGPKKRSSFELSPAATTTSKKQSHLQLKDSAISLVHTGPKSRRSFSANASPSLQSSAGKKKQPLSSLTSLASDNEQPKSSKRTPAGKKRRPKSSISSFMKTQSGESEESISSLSSATRTPRDKRGRPKSSLSSSSKKSRKEERVSFHQMVSVQEFSPHGATASTTSLQTDVLSHSPPPAASLASDLPAAQQLPGSQPGKRSKLAPSSPRLFSDTIEEVPDVNPVHPKHSVNPNSVELEPLDEEEEEEEIGEDPQLATPRMENVAGYEDMDSDEPTEVAESRSQVKRGRPRKTQQIGTAAPSRARACRSPGTQNLPRSLLKNLFCLYSKRRLTRGAMDRVMKFSAEYLCQASEDLAAYSQEAGRRTIKVEDVKHLLQQQMRRDEHCVRKHAFESMVNSYLPMEYAEQLLPCVLMPSSKDV